MGESTNKKWKRVAGNSKIYDILIHSPPTLYATLLRIDLLKYFSMATVSWWVMMTRLESDWLIGKQKLFVLFTEKSIPEKCELNFNWICIIHRAPSCELHVPDHHHLSIHLPGKYKVTNTACRFKAANTKGRLRSSSWLCKSVDLWIKCSEGAIIHLGYLSNPSIQLCRHRRMFNIN